jgi:predicted DNA-binding ribbon-helix-helix protein
MRRMSRRRSVVLTDQQWLALQREADRLEMTIAELLRRIIDQWRGREERL